jgi:hypothetical protein
MRILWLTSKLSRYSCLVNYIFRALLESGARRSRSRHGAKIRWPLMSMLWAASIHARPGGIDVTITAFPRQHSAIDRNPSVCI